MADPERAFASGLLASGLLFSALIELLGCVVAGRGQKDERVRRVDAVERLDSGHADVVLRVAEDVLEPRHGAVELRVAQGLRSDQARPIVLAGEGLLQHGERCRVERARLARRTGRPGRRDRREKGIRLPRADRARAAGRIGGQRRSIAGGK